MMQVDIQIKSTNKMEREETGLDWNKITINLTFIKKT